MKFSDRNAYLPNNAIMLYSVSQNSRSTWSTEWISCACHNAEKYYFVVPSLSVILAAQWQKGALWIQQCYCFDSPEVQKHQHSKEHQSCLLAEAVNANVVKPQNLHRYNCISRCTGPLYSAYVKILKKL